MEAIFKALASPSFKSFSTFFGLLIKSKYLSLAGDISVLINSNNSFFKLPEPLIDETTSYLPGLDGNKMSKSYSNYIDLFSEEKKLQKQINQIKTDSLEPGEKKPKDSTLYKYFKCFSNEKSKERKTRSNSFT